MNLEEIVKATCELEKDVTLVYEFIQLYRQDLEAQDFGYLIHYAIDYSEVYRYLVPMYDRVRRIDKDLFFAEQLAIHYVIEKLPQPVIMLPPHLDEFRHHLVRMRRNMKVYSVATERFLSFKDYLYLISDDTAFKQIMQALEKTDQIKEKSIRDAAKQASKFFLDLLLDNVREKTLSEAMEKFKSLSGKRIITLNIMQDVDTSVTISEFEHDYQHLFESMSRKRPERDESNEYDSKALLYIKKLNELNCNNKHLFLLISSSKLIHEELTSVKSTINVKGEPRIIHFLREPRYFLLMMHYEGEKLTEIIEDLKNTEHLIGQYSTIIAKFHYFLSKKKMEQVTVEEKDIQGAMQIYEELKNKVMLFRGLQLSRLENPFYTETKKQLPKEGEEYEYLLALLKQIKGLIEDTEKVRVHISNVIKELNDAIKHIHNMLDEFFPQGN